LKFRTLSRYILIPALFLGLALTFSCSTKKNTFTRRAFHNVNTHYNVYWNGNESFKTGVTELQSAVRDNYNKVLPVFNYGTPEEAKKVTGRMDRAIEKATIGIRRHSMVFGNKEYNRWIDDCFMLIGKAQFYKQDYSTAIRTFEHIMSEYQGKPVYYEALLWIAQANIQQKRYEEALVRLDELDGLLTRETVPFRIRKTLPLVYADYYLRTKNVNAARNALLQGIELNTGGKTRVRLYYILGQLYQQEKNFAMSTEYFTKAAKGPASFEMAFNARISLARSFDVYSGDKAGLEKELRKMLRDGKNKDFRDQIYYALAELSQIDQNDTLTMSYLKKSVATSTDNDFQKTTSALKLAGMYFDRQNYEMAQSYYDTTLQVIPLDYPDYNAINSRTVTLTELVQNLQVVKYEDSLQRLAGMPDEQLNAIIQKIVEDYKKEEQRRKEEEELQQSQMAAPTNALNMRNENIQNIGGGGWYFYNPSAISFGYSEFIRKWGRRKLEDNWRLSNKRPVVSADETEVAENEPSDSASNIVDSVKFVKKSTDPKDPKTYLQQLPRTPEALALSNKHIEDALTNLGYIYKDGLQDTLNSIQTFENLIKRFPDSKNAQRIYYQLYLIYSGIPDSANAEKYKNTILNLFPGSEYARTLQDPDYLAQILARKNRALSLYEETYQAFERGQYRMVMLYCNEAISSYKDKDLLPRFEYLRAISQGKTVSIDTMLVSLNKIAVDYPSSPIIPLVQEVLQKYSKKQPPAASPAATAQAATTGNQQGSAPAQAPASAPATTGSIFTSDTIVPDIYRFNPKQTHFFIMMVDQNTVNINALKVRIADFNLKSFPNDNITVNAIVLESGWQMLTVSSFGNSEKAMNYFNTIMQSDYVLSQLKTANYRSFVISMENYPVFYREKKYQGYINFFNKYYKG